MIFLDANVILRFILDDHPSLSAKAKTIFESIDQGRVRVYVSLLAISEAVFTLERSYRLPKTEVAEELLAIFRLENVETSRKDLLKRALLYYADKNVGFTDAYQVALMEKKRIEKIYSFDRDFNKFPQIERLEE